MLSLTYEGMRGTSGLRQMSIKGSIGELADGLCHIILSVEDHTVPLL